MPALTHVLRTVWIQETGDSPYLRRQLPTGGIEVYVPIYHGPRMLGPLTGPRIDVIPPHTTVVGARFPPGAAPLLAAALDDLFDRHHELADVHGKSVGVLTDAVAGALRPKHALAVRRSTCCAGFVVRCSQTS